MNMVNGALSLVSRQLHAAHFISIQDTGYNKEYQQQLSHDTIHLPVLCSAHAEVVHIYIIFTEKITGRN